MRFILVTGGAGFIGSNYIKKTLEDFDDIFIVNLDLLTYAGNITNLVSLSDHERYIFFKGDIADKLLVEELFKKYKFKAVINFAAESHVDRSIDNPGLFLKTNVLGTQVLLDTAKRNWSLDAGSRYAKEFQKDVKFLQISTDEVYGSLGKKGLFSEDSPITPNSPYSASKASADLLVQAYFKTYNFPINITRCSNNYGPYQFPEKLIPLMIKNAIRNEKLPIYGDGLQVRDWIHVSDHVDAINTVLNKGHIGEVYNIGGETEKTNLEIVKLIVKLLDKKENLITYIKDRPGHDRRYAVNISKISNLLGWIPKRLFEEELKETVKWYQENEDWIANIDSGNYMNYN